MSTETQRIMRLPEVMHVTGLSRSSIYNLAKLNKFPSPIKLTERASGWESDSIFNWIKSRIKED